LRKMDIYLSIPIIATTFSGWLNIITYGVMAVIFISDLKWDKKTILAVVIRCLIAVLVYTGIDVSIRGIASLFPDNIFTRVDGITAFLSYFLTPLLVSALACIFIKDFNPSVRIVFSSLLLTSWTTLPAISFYLSDLFNSNISIIWTLPRPIILIILRLIIHYLNLNKYPTLSIWQLLIFESFIIIEIAILIITHLNFEFQILDIKTLNFISLLIWITEIFVYIFFFFFVRSYSENKNHELENQKLRQDIKLLTFMESNYENIAALKHDMKNQYAYISILYQQGKDEEAKKFFTEMAVSANEVLNFASTENRVLDITLNMIIAKAKEYGVEFEYLCSCPKETRFSDQNLFSLLINILDNAIEGSARSKIQKKKVFARIHTSGNYLFISVRNTVDPRLSLESIEKQVTLKKNKISHGYGKKIIKRIVDMYEGAIDTSVENGIYEVKVMLALEDEKNLRKEAENETH